MTRSSSHPDIVDAPGFRNVTFKSSGDIRMG